MCVEGEFAVPLLNPRMQRPAVPSEADREDEVILQMANMCVTAALE